MTEQADQKRTARIVHHKDGKRSIKRLGPKPIVSTVKHQPTTPEQRAAREPQLLKRTPQPKRPISLAKTSIQVVPEPKTSSAKRNARKIAKAPPAPITAAPTTIRERTYHEHSIDHSTHVNTTNQVPKLLRRIKARNGSHVEQFQRDYEMAGSDLRSSSMDGTGGGSSGMATPFPLAKVQAIDRLKAFEEKNMVAFLVCEAVLIYNATPTTIHAAGGPQHTVVSAMIRDSVEDLAGFYSPSRKRPDKRLAYLSKVIEEAKRKV